MEKGLAGGQSLSGGWDGRGGLLGLLVVGLLFGLGFLGFGDEVDPLEDAHFAAVADALAEFDDAGVAAGTVGHGRGNGFEEFLGGGFATQPGDGQTAGGEGEGFVGADAAVGPDFEGEFVVVGAATDAGVDDVVFDAPDGREEGRRRKGPGSGPGGAQSGGSSAKAVFPMVGYIGANFPLIGKKFRRFSNDWYRFWKRILVRQL